MIKFIDNQLNKISMYRLTLYYLMFLLGVAIFFDRNSALAPDLSANLFSIGFFIAVCWITNRIFARTFGVPANVESVYISALILALIIPPIQAPGDLWFMMWAGILAMASKYILAIKGKHIFNPVAVAVALIYLTTDRSATWWVGNMTLLPAVLIGGLLIVRKIGRGDMVISFLVTNIALTWIAILFSGSDSMAEVRNALFESPLFFFAFVILTEPSTTPPTKTVRQIYGALVGILFIPQFHIRTFYLTPELAILIGNIYSYMVSPKTKLILKLKEKIRVAPGIYDFVFTAPRKFKFIPGQYMEWTLGHAAADSRGNRRYFTLASSPTEQNIRLGVGFDKNSSSFKKAMLAMTRNTEIVAAQITGDFTLPADRNQKIVFLAGGVGITPFRSMIKYLLDNHQRRPITLIYAVKNAEDIIYKDVFDRAEQELGIKVIYTLTDNKNIPAAWSGNIGRLNADTIKSIAPDTKNHLYYISGSRSMVDSFRDLLGKLNVSKSNIKTDYFSGLA